MISNSKIDKIGELLKKDAILNDDNFKTLTQWRNSFSSTLDYYYKKIKSLFSEDDIVALARRLKRIESIQIKLKRYKTMRLSTFQDIAGIRVVFKNEILLDYNYSKLRSLTTRHKLKRLDDYHARPKDDGYRGMHLIYQTGNMSMIEIQLRTELEHIWATAVEIYGELKNISFKTGQGEDDWRGFFTLLSSYFAIKENSTPVKEHQTLSEKQIHTKLKKYIKKLNVIERLNASTNGFAVVVSKHNETGKAGKYALLELDLKSKLTKVEIFNKKDVEKAIEIYTHRELELKKDDHINIVFVNIENLEKIQKSYPNYFFNTKKLLEILSKIVLDQDFM